MDMGRWHETYKTRLVWHGMGMAWAFFRHDKWREAVNGPDWHGHLGMGMAWAGGRLMVVGMLL